MNESILTKVIISAVTVAILIPCAFYTIGFVVIRKEQNALNSKLETSVQQKVEKYLSGAGLENGGVVAQSGVLTKEDGENEDAFSQKVTDLVIDNISTEYKDELKNVVVQNLYDDVDSLVRQYYSEYTESEKEAISEGVKAVVISELYSYIQDMDSNYSEQNSLYTNMHEVTNRLTNKTDSMESKMAEIQSNYDAQLQKLQTKDKELQDEIEKITKTQTADVKSLKDSIENVNKNVNKALDAVSAKDETSTQEVYTTLTDLKKSLDNADKALESSIDTLDKTTAQNLETEISARKAAVEYVLNSLTDSSNQLLGSLDEAYDDIIEAMIIQKETLDSSIASTNKETKDAVTAGYQAGDAALNKKLDEQSDALNSKMNSTIEATRTALKNEYTNSNSALSALLDSTKSDINAKYDAAVTQLSAAVAANAQEIVKQAQALTAEINANSTQISNVDEKLDAKSSEIATSLNNLNNSINTLNGLVEELDENKIDKTEVITAEYDKPTNTLTIKLPSNN